jgi:N-succinyldiaminopimelate aminotransferase
MNPRLGLLQPYSFEKLRKLLAGVTPPAGLRPINLSIGEPQHPTPALLKDALAANLGGLARYPVTKGLPELRAAMAAWIARRHGLPSLDPETQVLPVTGSREAIFSIAQTVLDPDEKGALVVCPNPFYQIYEGATLLGGAQPYFVNALAANGFREDWDAVPADVWKATRLLYVCSPSNPTGRVTTRDEWRRLFELSDKHGFVIVSDECYGEIYFDEAAPPEGALAAAHAFGREGYPRLIVMGSLSKRSNAPGLRSGFAAGDRALIERFTLYRTYHGTAMSNAVQMASIAAWNDEAHVVENRRLYREKFDRFFRIVNPVLPLVMPDAAFYFWADVGGIACSGSPEAGDVAFARELFEATNMTVMPGSYFSRDAQGVNPGRGFLRIALVSSVDDAVEAAGRLRDFVAARAGQPQRKTVHG